jgi:hypothetical protein
MVIMRVQITPRVMLGTETKIAFEEKILDDHHSKKQ